LRADLKVAVAGGEGEARPAAVDAAAVVDLVVIVAR
jgi:hypothetical protein